MPKLVCVLFCHERFQQREKTFEVTAIDHHQQAAQGHFFEHVLNEGKQGIFLTVLAFEHLLHLAVHQLQKLSADKRAAHFAERRIEGVITLLRLDVLRHRVTI